MNKFCVAVGSQGRLLTATPENHRPTPKTDILFTCTKVLECLSWKGCTPMQNANVLNTELNDLRKTICLRKHIEDIYFFEVNTKYISSNVLKISGISRVRSTSEIADIFNT